MTDELQIALGKVLWQIADELRGAMNADDFRDYMLALLFLRHLSDNYEAKIAAELGPELPAPEEGGLEAWYQANPGDKDALEAQMRATIHYVIAPEYLFSKIAELARTESPDLLRTLDDGLTYIEDQSFERTFQGLFSELNLNSEKLGRNYAERNTRLAKIISAIDRGLSEFSTDVDTLGDAYEYLIGQFAAGSGKKAGEFYTPQAVSSVLSGLVTLDAQDPASGKRTRLQSILDFACGSGSLLLNVRHRLGADKIGKVYGQEKNITTYNLARMNMLLHGMRDSEFEIYHGDTLKNDWPYLRDGGLADAPAFDAIVANPPFSYRWDPKEETAQDPRFKSYGVAPKSAADFAFLLHGFHYLKEDGVMAIILPHGVLFRGGREATIRKKLLLDGHIDAVIGLPEKLFYSTGIPVCILVLKKCKQEGDVLIINASEHFEKQKRQHTLLPEHIDKILDTYTHRKEEERYSRRVPMSEIEDNDFNLNITRYVSTLIPEPDVDLEAVHQALQTTQKAIETARQEHNTFLSELGLPPI